MGLGILEDTHLERVPGTSPLNDTGSDFDAEDHGIDPGLLKHDVTGEIVLVPQPSDSPNDPYNWPKWKKELFTLAIVYGCGCDGAIGPLLTSALAPLAEEFDVPLQQFTLGLQGSVIVCIGFSGLFLNTLAVKIGKRPIYLFTTFGLAFTCFWAATATTFGSLVAARSVQGLMMAPFECLIPASIADVWFVHERGYRAALFNLGIVGGINLASPLAGLIIQYGSYRICLHAMGGAFVLMLLLVFLFMPETAYHRSGTFNIDGARRLEVSEVIYDDDELELNPNLSATNFKLGTSKSSSVLGLTTTTSYNPNRVSGELTKSYAKQLKIWDGYWDRAPFFSTFIRPFFMLGSPIVLWSSLLFTACISWLVLISFTLSQIFSAPPYNFSIAEVGASNISSFVATIIGTAVSGPIIDGMIKHLAKRNKGTFEPEFRLPIMVSFLIFTATGFFAWGQSLANKDPWPVPIIVCLGMINLGAQLGATGVTAYVVDSHREHSAEAFATMNLLKNLFAFGLSFYANTWIANQGVRNSFFTIGGITAAATLTTIPMYIYGKRARSFVFRSGLLDRSR